MIGLLLGFFKSSIGIYAILGLLAGVGGCALYKSIGDGAVSKAEVKGLKKKLNKREENIVKADKEYKKDLEKAKKLPVKGDKVTPKESLNNLMRSFQK